MNHDIKTHGDAGHSLMNDHECADPSAALAVLTRLTGNPYHEPSAADARGRIIGFFDCHLQR